MYDIKEQIYKELCKVSNNVFYAQIQQETPLPVITYKIINSIDDLTGKQFGYSQTLVQIDIWDISLASMTNYVKDIDSKLRKMGMTRTYYNELPETSRIHAVIQYECLIRENYI